MTELAHVETGTVDGVEVVRIVGEIDLSNADLVGDAVGAVIPDMHEVVLDLTETDYLDSAGVAMLFRLAQRLSYNRQELQLLVPPDASVRAAISLTKLDGVVRVRDRVAEPPRNS
jgi:anti-sigma B factor antagonist